MKKSIYTLLAAVLMLSVVGCTKEDVKETVKTTVKEETTIVKEEETEEILENQNLLTGLTDLSDDAVGKRPVAIMVNNVEAALPQYGVAQADIIFEIPVEGDLTRLMALYADYTMVPKICSVRSCRYYFPAFSQGFDAFYINWGYDGTVEEYLNGLNMDQYEGMYNEGNLFGRDENRLNSGYPLEHTGYFDGTQFVTVVESDGKRTDLADGKTGSAFRFNGVDEQIKAGDKECTVVDINFGGATATLTYNESTKTYLKDINGHPHMDGVTETQLSFTNVFVLETEISVRDDVGRKKIDCFGNADSVGYYISNGGVQKIHWSKASENDYLKFYDYETGEEIRVNRGKSYIAVNYKDQVVFK